MSIDKITVIPNPKDAIRFWLDAMDKGNLDNESIYLINKCLHHELNNYLYPVKVLEVKSKLEMSMPKPMIKAKQRVCTCCCEKIGEERNHIHINTIDLSGKGSELESLEEYYCTTCNSFWREP